MSDVVRRAFLNRHNELRSQLATGTAVNGQNGGKTRPAKNMTKLVYDCELEKAAYERARLCENFTPEDPKILKENYYSFNKNLTRPLEQYAKLATQVWWSELSRTGLNQTLNLFYTHLGISHFAKIGSDLTTKVGCGIYNCTSTINAVCLYETGLKHAYRLYAPAVKPCRECGDDKCANGLCPATVEGAKL
ncbi:SCP-like protein [Oesophagostomum dentatum]|uniref:SCP-like protein n=1 Tax=Oesophagostomum dentatum TaxID=61180 RepID=A0A0B1SDL0_OESDE|nr:SCP-like protein [Oesophagostomum dentatum]